MASLFIGNTDQNENGGSGFYALNGGRLSVTGYESIGQGGKPRQFHRRQLHADRRDPQRGQPCYWGYRPKRKRRQRIGFVAERLLAVTGYESIGQGGNFGSSTVGSFTQTGGTHSVPSLVIGAVDANDNGGNGFYSWAEADSSA